MNTKNRFQPQMRSLSNRLIAANWRERINTLTRCAAVVVAFLIGAFAGHAGELPRPGEEVDAGDSYRLKDGSRVALHRVLHEVAIKTCVGASTKNRVCTPLHASTVFGAIDDNELMGRSNGSIRRFQEVL